ncbi:MAG: hypothetical protein ACI4XW_00940, partial [Candidatus Spyradocola sp.]
MKNGLYDTELAAVEAFGRAALPGTERDGRERCAAIVRQKGGYRLGRTWRGFHNNVILQAVFIAFCSLFRGQTALVHTHPKCACHAGEAFSGERDARGKIRSLGDVCVPGMGRIRRIWLVSPAGFLSCWDGKNPPLRAGKLTDERGEPLYIRTPCA